MTSRSELPMVHFQQVVGESSDEGTGQTWTADDQIYE